MSSDPISGVCQELNDLFSWNPPYLSPQSGKKPSISSRKPAYFNKHFSKAILLKRVELLPSLVQDIAMTIDNAIIYASKSGIELPPPKGLLTAEQIERTVGGLDTTVQDENGVASFYERTTATFCSCLASTLALHPRALDWRSLVVWMQSGDSGYAIADGFLRIVKPHVNESLRANQVMLEDSMTDETRIIYQSLRGEFRERFPSLATWEMKNLAAGSHEVIRAIPSLKNAPFDRTLCEEPMCAKLKNHQRETRRVAEMRL